LSIQFAKLGFPFRALELARSLDHGSARIEALLSIAPYLPEPQQSATRREWLEEARGLGDLEGRSRVVDASIEQFTEEASFGESCSDADYEFWASTMQLLGSSTRKHVLSSLNRMIPLLARLGGETALAEAVQAIAEVGAWFP
jgi:hypothetical protein